MSGLCNEIVLNGQKILKETNEPITLDEKEILQYAKFLGISVDEEPHHLWIATKGYLSGLPSKWLPIEDVKGRIYYFNTSTSVSSWLHPADIECKRLLRKSRRNPSLVIGAYENFQDFIRNKYPNMNSENTQKKFVSVPDKRSVRFDLDTTKVELSYESGTGSDSDMDDLADKFGLMDAESLSPAFIRSPEPDEVNSLLRLTSMDPQPIKSMIRSPSSLSPLPSMDMSDKRMNFLKPLSPIAKPLTPNPPKNDNVLLKPKDIKTIEVIADPLLSTLSDSTIKQTLAKPSMPQKLNAINSTPKPTPPKSNSTFMKSTTDPFPLSDEELQLKVDHEMALIDIRNRYEDEREMEEEKLKENLEEFKTHLAKEKDNLQASFQVELAKMKEELENNKKDEIKKIESQNNSDLKKILENCKNDVTKDIDTLKGSLKKKHDESLTRVKNELEKEYTTSKKTIENEYSTKKNEQKVVHEKEMVEMKKKYTVELAKAKLDLEKELQRKTADIKKENDAEIKTLENELEKSRKIAEQETKQKLEDWKKSEEAKLIQAELQSLHDQIKSKTNELELQNQKVSELTKTKETLQGEVNTLELKAKSWPKVPEIIVEDTRPNSEEKLQLLHEKVDSYIHTFNEQLQSLYKIVEAYQQREHSAPAHSKSQVEENYNSTTSSNTLSKNERNPQAAELHAEEFLDLKELLKHCKQKLRNLERKRFEVHAYEAFDLTANPGTSSAYNGYWNESMARKKESLRKAKRFLGINTAKRKRCLPRYQYGDYSQESISIAKMAEKLTKQLDHEAKELQKMEAHLRRSCQPEALERNHDNSDSSGASSSSSSQSEIAEGYNRKYLRNEDDLYQPYIPYVPLTIQLKQHQQLHSQHFPPQRNDNHTSAIETRVKEAWAECFGERSAPVIARNCSQNNEELQETDHAKWMEKIREMKQRIRQTDTKQKDKRFPNR